jgi:hypothetical protein
MNQYNKTIAFTNRHTHSCIKLNVTGFQDQKRGCWLDRVPKPNGASKGLEASRLAVEPGSEIYKASQCFWPSTQTGKHFE